MLARDQTANQFSHSLVSNFNSSATGLNKPTNKPPTLKQLINPNRNFENAQNIMLKKAKSTQVSKTASSSNHSKNSIGRSEKSLTSLTTKFMSLLQESQNGILDLKNVILI